jgi:hypothetical protein
MKLSGGHALRHLSITVLLVSVLAGCTSSATSPPGSSSATPARTSALPRVYERGGTIFVVADDGSPVALTRGLLPTPSPDGTMIAFLRDPADPHYHGGGDPFVLQVWLIDPDDGSGLRKLGQQHECCIGVRPHLNWSADGSSIVLKAIREQTWDVGTGESLSMPSPTG